MRRLVYTPRAYVFVKDSEGNIRDLTGYVTGGSVTRRVSAVSSADITLRNPKMIFTAHKEGKGIKPATFRPMDPITIFLRRHRGRPVRVFTGFLDTTPYIQLYPGTITLKASCTLKRLLHTYWDPALIYSFSFMNEYGWIMKEDGQWISFAGLDEFKPDKDEDGGHAGVNGSLSQLIFATLKHVGHWDDDTIYVEPLPKGLFDRIAEMAESFVEDAYDARKAFAELMKRVIGEGDFGTGDSDVDVSDIDGDVAEVVYKVGRELGVATDSKLMLSAFMTGIVESGMRNLSYGDADSQGWRQERASLYADPTNVNNSAKRYFVEGKAIIAGKAIGKASTGYYQDSWSAGQLAQAIQGSAYPSRYDEVKSRALALLRRVSIRVDGEDDDANRSRDNSGKPTPEMRRSKTKGGTTKGDEDKKGRVHPLGTQFAHGEGMGYGRGRLHAGVDIAAPMGTPVRAAHAGKVLHRDNPGGYGTYIDLVGDGVTTRYAHLSARVAGNGEGVDAGDLIGRVGSTGSSTGPHLHFEVRTGGPDQFGGTGVVDPEDWLKGAANPSGSGSSSGSGTDSNLASSVAAGGAAGAFLATLDFPTMMDLTTAQLLTEERSLMNDVPLLPFVQQLCQASLREFQSLPDGKFYAFYPDYFGELGQHPPYWEIDDIEVLDGGVNLSDDALVTHQYVVGDTINPLGGGPMSARMISSAGVVTIFNMFMADAGLDRTTSRQKNKKDARKAKRKSEKTGPGQKEDPSGMDIILDRDEAAVFLDRYGARPQMEDMPMLKNNYYEFFMAYQKFLQAWSKQFITPFVFTFMPELFPGGKVGFPDHGLQMYIEEVTHSWNYESGFTTQATMSSPSVYGDQNELLPPNMVQAIIDPVRAEAVVTRAEREARRQKSEDKRKGKKK